MKLKICMLIARFHPVSGGTELQAQRLAEELAANNHEVFVLTAKLASLAGYEKNGNIEIYRTNAAGKGLVSSFNFLVSSFLFLLKNRGKYDFIHVHLASSHAFAAIIIKILFKKKIILKFGGARATGDIGTSMSKPWGRLKLGLIKKFFDAFIVPGAEVAREAAAAGFDPSRISMIPNGVNTDMFKPVFTDEKISYKKNLNLPPERFLFLYTGRIEKGKGLETILPLWSGFPENICLVIAGTGRLSAELKNRFGGRNVYFTGYCPNIHEYLRACDAFIFPSFGEGMSNALLEAMSCGLPVAANDIPANAELIKNGVNGILTDVEDKNGMRALVLDIVSNYGKYLKMGQEARKTVEQKYSMKIVAGEYIRMYEKLAAV